MYPTPDIPKVRKNLRLISHGSKGKHTTVVLIKEHSN